MNNPFSMVALEDIPNMTVCAIDGDGVRLLKDIDDLNYKALVLVNNVLPVDHVGKFTVKKGEQARCMKLNI